MIVVKCVTHGISFTGWKQANKHAGKCGKQCFLSAEMSHVNGHKRMKLEDVHGSCDGDSFYEFI